MTAIPWTAPQRAPQPPLTLARADEVAALREKCARQEVEIARLDALVKERDAQIADIAGIVTQKGNGWVPTTKVLLTAIKCRAFLSPNGDAFTGLEGSAAFWQEVIGLGEKTIGASLRQLDDAKVITRNIERARIDHPDGAHTFRTDSTLSVPTTPGQTLPAALPESPRRKSAARASSRQREAMRAVLSGIACAHCGTIGDFTVTCASCGEPLDLADHDHDHDHPEGQDLKGCKVPDKVIYRAQNAPTAAKQSLTAPAQDAGQPPDAPPAVSDSLKVRSSHLQGATLAGAATIDYLASLGAAFTLAQPRDKAAYKRDWQTTPESLKGATAHLQRGGNVGLLSGASTDRADGVRLVVIDLDADAAPFLAAHADLAGAPQIWRRNAPDRCKVIVGVVGEPGHYFKASDKARRRIEYMAGRHHGIVAGTHATGAVIECVPGHVPVATADHWLTLCRAWAGEPVEDVIEPTSRRAPDVAPGQLARGDLRGLAIAWWNSSPANRAAVDELLARCPRAAGKVAIRPDDRTPSACWTKDDYGKRIMRDYGTSESLDDFELWLRLTGKDKRAAVGDVVIEYCRVHGLQAPTGLRRRQ